MRESSRVWEVGGILYYQITSPKKRWWSREGWLVCERGIRAEITMSHITRQSTSVHTIHSIAEVMRR